jgi:uncharacterized sulfatase
MPHQSWMQDESFSDGSPFRRELKRLAAAGKFGPGPMTYAAPRRAREELYDTQSDPHQLRNLAGEPEHRSTLQRLRAELRRWQLATRDAGFLTEPQMWARLKKGETPWDLARDESRYPLACLLEAADAVGRDGAAPLQRGWLNDADDGVRYWAAVGLHAADDLAEPDRAPLRQALQDESPVVRIESAAALARHGEADGALPVLAAALADDSQDVVLHAARALQLLGPAARPVYRQMESALAKARGGESAGDDIAMFIRFSLEAALDGA